MTSLRVVVVGATGNVGTSVVRALVADPNVASVVGVARRAPATWPASPNVTWRSADIVTDALAPVSGGAAGHRAPAPPRRSASGPTPPLAAAAAGPLRLRELATGVGARSR
jgi:hypothetical protein